LSLRLAQHHAIVLGGRLAAPMTVGLLAKTADPVGGQHRPRHPLLALRHAVCSLEMAWRI
jgi:hypothetical protein